MRLLAALLLCLALPMAWGEPSASTLANEVIANGSWASDLHKCPADLFAADSAQTYSRHVRQQCTTPSSQGACMTACKSGQGEHCYWLATTLQGSESTNQAAEILFQRACKLGVASGCTNRAAGMMPEPPAKVTPQSCPARTFERTCAANDPWGCSMYGFILGHDKGSARNKQRAMEALSKSCLYGEDDPACKAAKAMRKELQP